MAEGRMTGYGMVLELGTDVGAPYTRIHGLTEIKPPKQEVGTVDVTEHRTPDEPDHGSMEYIGDPLKDHGEITGKINYIMADATQAQLEGVLGLTRWYRVKYPQDVRVIETKGILTKFEEPNLDAKGKTAIQIDFAIKVTGKPVVA
jgi:hypothetical protein